MNPDEKILRPDKHLRSYIPYVLAVITAIKILAVVFCAPIMGYANNFDFTRQSHCTGLWQVYPDSPAAAKHVEKPVNSLLFSGNKNLQRCMRSADNFFPWVVTKFHRIGDHVDFREISLCRTLFITASFMLLIFLIDDLTVKILISSLFFLVFGDLVNLLYFNTLYLEFSVIAGCFLSLSAAVWLMASSKRPSWPMMVFSMSALSWLGLSKQQYMPFAALLSVFLSVSIFLRWKNKRMTFAFVLLALLLPLGYERFNPNSTGIMKKVNFANKTDTFLGAVLEAADDRKGALSILGLSDTCMEGIGKNWYSPGIQQNHPCPQIETLSRVRLFRLFILQPSTFFKPMYKALIRICPFYSNRLGHLERPADRESGRYGLFKITSFSNLLVALPRPMYFWMIVISMISWPVFMFLAIRGDQPMKKNSEHYRLMFTMLSLGGLTVFYAVVSSVFGDGYADISKHTVVLINGMIFQVGAVGLKLFPHKV